MATEVMRMVVVMLLMMLLLAEAPLCFCSSRSVPDQLVTTLHKRQIPAFRAYNYLVRKSNGSTTGSGYNTVLSSKPIYGDEPLEFGSTYTFDMPLVAAKSVNASKIGKVRGTYTFVDQTGGSVVFVAESFVVENWVVPGTNAPPLNGTFSALGLEYIGLNSTKPIVGGTDDFTLASGIAITHPLPSDTGSVFDSNGNLFLWFMYDFIFA